MPGPAIRRGRPGRARALARRAREVELLTSPGGHLDRAAASQHIDQHSGDFSVEVLKAALAQLGCRLVNAEHAEVVERLAEAPEAEEGYLMHRSSHWRALRPLAGIWWNLDSRLARPRRLSAAALRELVTRLRVDGGTVHVVQQLPPPAVHNAGHAGREQVLHPVEYLLTSTEPELLRGADADAADDADAALAAALEAEKAEAAAFGGSDPDAALAAALQREEEEAAAAAAAVAEAERARRAERSWLPSFGSTREPAAGSAAAGAAAGAASGAAPPPAGGEWLRRMGRMIGDGFDQLAGSMRAPRARRIRWHRRRESGLVSTHWHRERRRRCRPRPRRWWRRRSSRRSRSTCRPRRWWGRTLARDRRSSPPPPPRRRRRASLT